jgi:uncharacterized protein YqeY
MSLVQVMRDRVKVAMKSGNLVEKSILKLILGECDTLLNSAQQGGKPLTDEQVSKVLRKIILSNNETLGYNLSEDKKSIIFQENEILESLLPKLLTQDEIREKISSIEADIKSAKSEGQAVGVAMKLLKQTNESVDGNDVKSVVVNLRNL